MNISKRYDVHLRIKHLRTTIKDKDKADQFVVDPLYDNEIFC